MSHPLARLAFGFAAVAFLVVGLLQAPALAQRPGRQEDNTPLGPQRPVIPPPAATPSGTISNSTQGIAPYEAPVQRAPAAAPKPKENLVMEDTLYLDLDYGRVVIKLHPELAPKTVARFKELVRQGFYDGLIFHRVIEGFMAQTGDPKGDGSGGSGQNLMAEFNSGRHVRGAVSMARSSNINSADSQFYIVLGDSPHLNGQYTYFGEVVEGMEFVDQIHKGDPGRNGAVPYPDHIIRLQVAADAAKTETPQEQAAAKPAAKSAKTN